MPVADGSSESGAERQRDVYFLNKPDQAIAILEGSVSVFSQESTILGKPGRRQHLFDRQAGDFVFSVPEAAVPWLMIHDQAKIEVLPVSSFFTADSEAEKSRLIQALESWVEAISDNLLNLPSPVDPVLLPAGKSSLLPAGKEASVSKGVVWVEIQKGCCSFLGQDDCIVSQRAAPFPLTSSSWLAARGEQASLRVMSSAQLLDANLARKAIQGFHEAADKVLQEKAISENYKRQTEAAQRDELDRGKLGIALDQMRQILSAKTIRIETTTPETALFAACRIVGKHCDLEFKMPLKIRKSKENEDSLSMIAFESRTRYRWVRYEKDWWLHDNGPLLGFKGAEASPVALIPESWGKYICYDPQSGLKEIVDEKLAKRLGKGAVVFYKSLDDSPQDAWQILRFSLRGQRQELMQLLALAITAGVLSLALPLFAGRIFRETIPSGNYNELSSLVIVLLIICISQALFNMIRLLNLSRVEQKSGNILEAALWDRLLRLPVSFFRQFTIGDLMDRVMSVQKLRQSASANMSSLFYLFVIAVCNLALMLRYDAALAMLIVSLALLGLAALIYSSRKRAAIEKERMEVSGRFVAYSLDLIANVAKLRLAGADLRALSIWAGKTARNQRLLLAGTKIETAIANQISLTPLVCSALLFIGIVLLTPKMKLEDFVIFNLALIQFLAALLAIYKNTPDLFLLQIMFQRFQRLLEAVPEPEQSAVDPGLLKGAIEFQSVTVSYDNDEGTALQDVSFRIKPGEFVAFVGKSGSGKSTILRTLIGFEKPLQGSVFMDGKDLSELDLRSVRKQMGVVLQNDKLIPGSVYLNIVGNSDLGKEAAWEAAKMAGLSADIDSWPMGMDTALIEGASTISGGQKQRLMIARAIVRKPKILILDEATSALDNKTQNTVMKSLKRLNATRIVVAQRLSTVQDADRIYVLDQGRIVETGRYEQLILAGGKFAELARRQLS